MTSKKMSRRIQGHLGDNLTLELHPSDDFLGVFEFEIMFISVCTGSPILRTHIYAPSALQKGRGNGKIKLSHEWMYHHLPKPRTNLTTKP